MKADLKNLCIKEIEELTASLGLPHYSAKQIAQWVFKHNAATIDVMTNLSKQSRIKLNEVAYISSSSPERVLTSVDKSKKFIFKTVDDYRIESVLLPEKKHWTLCISTQIGCSMGCKFCCTGKNGLIRNLSISEIINQVSAIVEYEQLKENPPNIVFMGMGEPLANYRNTLESLKILLSPYGFGLSHRKITVSTAGLIPQIKRLLRELPINLAISLNAPTDTIRSFLMPINKKFSLKKLLSEAKSFSLPPRKRITFEYVLIKDINDAPEHAKMLVRLLHGLPSKINLIPFNEFSGTSFKRPETERALKFQSILRKHHLTAPIRNSKGSDISAACGLLGGKIDRG